MPLDATLSSLPIPCLSPLSGNVRPATAAAALEESWKQLHRKPNRTWMYGAPQQQINAQGQGQVHSLTGAALHQLSSMSKVPEAPYRRALTPQEKADIEKRVSKQVEVLAKVLQEAQLSSADGQQGFGTAPAAAGGQDLPKASASGGDISKPMTPQQVLRSIKDMLGSRPNSSMSVQDLTLPRPSSKLIRVRGLPSTPGGLMTASWSGPLLDHPAAAQPAPFSVPGKPGSAPTTPKRTGSRSGPRASTLKPFMRVPGNAPPPPEVWVNPLARPPAGTSAEEEERRQRALLRSSMGNAAAADATGTTSTMNAAAHATARLLLNKASFTPGALPNERRATQLLSRPVTAAPAVGMDGGQTGTQEIIRALLDRPLGAPGNPRWGPGQPLQAFVPTRGLVYSVFAELDPGDTGKLTYSALEEACVQCGLKQETCRRLFETLDPMNRGYFTVRDWGAKEHEKQVTEFTRLYIYTTRGTSGKPLNVREMKSVTLAVQVALHRLQIKNHGRVVSQEKLMHAFEFMDTDASGSLSLAEVQDAFNAMSIYVTPEVLTEIMENFDTNKNGVIEYREFLGALYPVLSKGM